MFRKKHSLIKGTLILTSAGLVSRVLGFFFRIFLSHTFGEEQVGLYQLIFPFYALCLSLSTSGLETAISRSVSRFHSLGRTQDGKLIFQTGLILSVLISLICTFLVQKNSVFLSNRFLGDPRCATLLSGGFCPQLYLWLSLWSAKNLCPGYFTVNRTICSNFFCFCFIFYFYTQWSSPCDSIGCIRYYFRRTCSSRLLAFFTEEEGF